MMSSKSTETKLVIGIFTVLKLIFVTIFDSMYKREYLFEKELLLCCIFFVSHILYIYSVWH